jgi:hypothetical protein
MPTLTERSARSAPCEGAPPAGWVRARTAGSSRRSRSGTGRRRALRQAFRCGRLASDQPRCPYPTGESRRAAPLSDSHRCWPVPRLRPNGTGRRMPRRHGFLTVAMAMSSLSKVAAQNDGDRSRGALLGLAVGDALGAPLEGAPPATAAAAVGTGLEMTGGGWVGGGRVDRRHGDGACAG